MNQREYVPVLLQIVNKNCLPAAEHTDGGIYVGAAGVAYAFYHVAQSGVFEEKREQFLSTAEKYIKVKFLLINCNCSCRIVFVEFLKKLINLFFRSA